MTSLPAQTRGPVSPVVRTVTIPDPGPLLGLLPDAAPLAWVRRGEGLVGWGSAAAAEIHGPEQFAEADRWWRDLVKAAVVRDEVGLPGCGPVVFGSFAFDEHSGSSVMVMPRVVVGHRNGQWWVTTVGVQGALPPAVEINRSQAARRPAPLAFADGTRSGAEWELVVEEAVSRINSGDLEKVVLARDLVAESAAPVDPRWPLARLAENYPRCWTFCVDGLLGATPELLVRLERGLVTSRVLAGTIRRTGDDAHDLALAASLARSSKDLEEHEYAVRSVASALRRFCSSMNVPETPFVLHLANVMHLATDVTGVAAEPPSSLALAAALHPTAAVCGTPTGAAAALIAEIEGMNRGRYAGPVGWMDAAGDGEWGIALRCARIDPDDPARLRLFAGCGIVAGSDPEAELSESAAKLIPMRDALSG
ncbi:MAG TPA: isochorismate synthase [Jiangellaceae bacterium]|nr:isochorismate synthase [Jiangellaceae bacterium]